uniref:Oxysterol-binding protein n=1 Tax=Ditylenchus dipsaci TaxID=166011 RepID=A0A915D6Y9_9BILA
MPKKIVQNVPETIEKCGWLQKWTNYMKGYRQRWFVLDGNGNLSYYRNEIHSDPIADTLVISASSQSFHLKAQNDVDRSQWLHALEYSRHRVLKEQHADSDDENQNVRNKKKKSVRSPEQISTTLNEKMAEIRAVGEELNGHATELKRFLNDRSEEVKSTTKFATNYVTTSDELTGLATTDCRNLTKYASKEHEQKIQLREQLETLAHQHSRLEKVAFSNANKSGGVKVEQPPYIENDDEIFHDATDDLDEFKLTEQQERKSASSHSRQESVCDDQDAEIFNAEIVIDGGRTTMAEFNQIQDDNRAVENSKLVTTTAVSPYKKRRDCIPERPHGSISLWSIMRNCIGKELTKIPMPVNFNEPLSVCQRITEDLEYAYLLDRAAEKQTPVNKSAMTTKPFNPVLGETYECDRTEDLGWRSLTEQVSHHPPATAHHAEGQQWTMFQEITMTFDFGENTCQSLRRALPMLLSKIVELTTPTGNYYNGTQYYCWETVDNHGEMFSAYSYFSSEKPRKVNGVVKDKQGVVRYIIQGFWDRHVDILQVSKHERGAKNVLENLHREEFGLSILHTKTATKCTFSPN